MIPSLFEFLLHFLKPVPKPLSSRLQTIKNRLQPKPDDPLIQSGSSLSIVNYTTTIILPTR